MALGRCWAGNIGRRLAASRPAVRKSLMHVSARAGGRRLL